MTPEEVAYLDSIFSLCAEQAVHCRKRMSTAEWSAGALPNFSRSRTDLLRVVEIRQTVADWLQCFHAADLRNPESNISLLWLNINDPVEILPEHLREQQRRLFERPYWAGAFPVYVRVDGQIAICAGQDVADAITQLWARLYRRKIANQQAV